MPESVKISQLPVASSVQGTDLVPVVKMVGATPAETNRATAAQIAAIGGGPPGANSVTDAAIANGALSASKSGYSTSQRIAISKTQTTVNGQTRFVCEETECSEWAQSLLAADNAAQGWGVLSANPTFSGPINVPRGSPTAPSYGFTGAAQTGIYLSADDDVSISVQGKTVFSIGPDRTIYTLPPGASPTATDSMLQPAIPVRAYALFTPGTSAQTITLGSAKEVGLAMGFNFYTSSRGYWNPPAIYNTSIARQGVETKLKTIYVGSTGYSFDTTALDGRDNFTSCGDNDFLTIDANGAKTGDTPACGKNWIGKVIFTTAAGASTVLRHSNVSSVTAAAGVYTIKFWTPMPTTDYLVFGGAHTSDQKYYVTRVISRSTTQCEVQFGYGTTGTTSFTGNDAALWVAVVR